MTLRRLGWAAGAAAIAVILAAAGWGMAHPATPIPAAAAGQAAPELVVRSFDGATIRLSELRGRPVVLNFWASWCVPCRQEDPALRTAARAHAGQVTFLGVDIKDSGAAARAYEQSARHPYPVGDAVSGGAADFGVTAPPETVFIDASGRLAGKFVGPLDDRTLARYLELVGVR